MIALKTTFLSPRVVSATARLSQKSPITRGAQRILAASLAVPAAAAALLGTASHAQAGACCISQGGCIVTQNAQQCSMFFAGVYNGDGSICETDPCAIANLLNLADLSGGQTRAKVFAVSADGRTAVGEGTTSTASEPKAIRWREANNWMPEDISGGSPLSSARAVSADGLIIAGNLSNDFTTWHGFVVNAAGGRGTLANFLNRPQVNFAAGLSPDGQVVVGSWDGYVSDPNQSGTYAGLWQSLNFSTWDLESLGDFSGGQNRSVANARSNNGVTVGYGYTAAGRVAFRSGVSLGGFPNSNTFSGATALNADGSVVVGYATRVNTPEFLEAPPTNAFRWTAATGMVDLDPNRQYYDSKAQACSANGYTIVGVLQRTQFAPSEPFIWQPALGIIPLSDYLAQRFPYVDPAYQSLRSAESISADGATIALNGTLNGQIAAYLLKLPSPPSNDLRSGAIDVSAGGTFTGSLNHATGEEYWGCPDGLEIGEPYPDVWYRFTAAGPGSLRATTSGTNNIGGPNQGLDTMIDLLDAFAAQELACSDTCISCAANPAGGGTYRDADGRVTLSGPATVFIRVRYVSGPLAFPFRLSVTFTPATAAPVITTQPIDREICNGASGDFIVAATGTNRTYRWQFFVGSASPDGWDDIVNGHNGAAFFGFTASGANTPTLNIGAMELANHSVRCIVSNPGGSVTSSQAAANRAALPIVATLAPLTVCRGTATELSLTALGSPATIFRWYRNDAPVFAGQVIPGSSFNGNLPSGTPITVFNSGGVIHLAISHIAAADAGFYRMEATNVCGTSASNTVLVTVRTADFNCNGEVSVQDIFDFLNAWFATALAADINESGDVSLQDLFDYLAAYFGG